MSSVRSCDLMIVYSNVMLYSVSVQSFAGSYRYSLYEVWQSSEYLST